MMEWQIGNQHIRKPGSITRGWCGDKNIHLSQEI